MSITGIRSHSSSRPVGPNLRFGSVDAFQNQSFNYVPHTLGAGSGAMSVQDIVSRLMVLTIYVPQIARAFWTQQVPYETTARNIAAWFLSIVVLVWGKHDKVGWNPYIHKLMLAYKRDDYAPLPKTVVGKLKFALKNPLQALDRVANYARPVNNYLIRALLSDVELNEIEKGLFPKAKDLKPEQIKKGVVSWERLLDLKKRLKKEIKGGQSTHVSLSKELKAEFKAELKHLKKVAAEQPLWLKFDTNEFRMIYNYEKEQLKNGAKNFRPMFRRMFLTQMTSLGFSTILTSILVGIWMQRLVFKLVSPLDRLLVPKVGVSEETKKQFNLPQVNSHSASGRA